MKTWEIAVSMDMENKNTPCIKIYLIKDSWLYLCLNWFVEVVVWNFCDFFHKIKLPKFIRNIERNWGKDKIRYKFEDWYGPDLGGLFHVFICNPAFGIVNSIKRTEPYCIKLTKEEAIEAFKNNPEEIKWALEQYERWEQYESDIKNGEQEEKREVSEPPKEGSGEDNCKPGRDSEVTKNPIDNQ